MKRRNKAIAAMLVAAMTASLAMTGCGGTEKASNDKKELTVWAWDVALKALEDAGFRPREIGAKLY